MKIHEYQAMALLKTYGVDVPEGGHAETAEEAREVAKGLGTPIAVKAQIHAGGRGKGVLDVHNLVILSAFPIASHRQLRHEIVAPPDYRLVTAAPASEAPELASAPLGRDSR